MCSPGSYRARGRARARRYTHALHHPLTPDRLRASGLKSRRGRCLSHAEHHDIPSGGSGRRGAATLLLQRRLVGSRASLPPEYEAWPRRCRILSLVRDAALATSDIVIGPSELTPCSRG